MKTKERITNLKAELQEEASAYENGTEQSEVTFSQLLKVLDIMEQMSDSIVNLGYKANGKS